MSGILFGCELTVANAVGQDARAFERVDEVLNLEGWSQDDLEAHLENRVKRATISSFETGRRVPSMPTLVALTRAFKVELIALLLDPRAQVRHRAAIAIVDSPEEVFRRVVKVLDLE